VTFYAFEPHPGLFKLLSETCAFGGFKNIHPIQAAVGDREGAVDFFTHTRDSGGHSTVVDSIGADKRATQVQSVPMVRLDSFCETTGIKSLDFIKIDVQDAERAVILGAQKSIQKYRPVILMELDNRALALQGAAYLGGLPEDYLFRTSELSILQPLSEMGKQANAALAGNRLQSNYLFVPKSRSAGA